MEEKMLKMIASDIARQPILKRWRSIYVLLKDLDRNIERKDKEKTNYIS
jgi:hypothetical protein